MKPIKVYVMDMDRLPGTILTSLMRETDDIEVVFGGEDPDSMTEPRTLDELTLELERHAPDVVLVALREHHRLEAVKELLRARVLLLAERGRSVLCYQLTPDSRSMGEMSADAFLATIRGTS